MIAASRTTGQMLDPSTTKRIANLARDRAAAGTRPSAAQRLAHLARMAASEAEATEAVRRALKEILQ